MNTQPNIKNDYTASIKHIQDLFVQAIDALDILSYEVAHDGNPGAARSLEHLGDELDNMSDKLHAIQAKLLKSETA